MHAKSLALVHHLVQGNLVHMPLPTTVGYAFRFLTPGEQRTLGPKLLHRFVEHGGQPPELLHRFAATGPERTPKTLSPHDEIVLRRAKALAAREGEQTQRIAAKAAAAQTAPGAAAPAIKREQRRFVKHFTPHTVKRGISSTEAGLLADIGLVAAPELLPLDALRLGRIGGKVADIVRGGRGAEKASEAAKPASEAIAASERATKGLRGAARAKVGRAGKAVTESRAGRAVERTATETRVGRGIVRGARAARPVARVGTYPFRRPVRFSLRAQAPQVATHGLAGFTPALTGTGTAAHVLGSVGGTLGNVPLAGNVLKDAFNLPATAIPSVYLPLQGAIHYAATGDDSKLRSLLDQYSKHGLLPAVFRGDPSAALRAIEHHPLYSALEASGAYAVAGRGAGTALRAARIPGAGTKRAPLHVYGHRSQERAYSKNIITKAGQVAAERVQRSRGRNPNVATERQANAYISGHRIEGHRRGAGGVVHRFIEKHELKRRENRHRVVNEHMQAAPKRAPRDGVVAEVAQGSIRAPHFHDDLAKRIVSLRREGLDPNLTKAERKLNTKLVKQLEAAQNANPRQIAEVIRAAHQYAIDHNIVTDQATARGLYDPHQVQQAKVFPYAIAHMGATHGVPKGVGNRLAAIEQEMAVASTREGRRAAVGALVTGEEGPASLAALRTERDRLKQTKPRLLDAQGNPLGHERVHAHMVASGVDPEHVGFFTHAPGINEPRSFNQRAHSRQQISRKLRTGEAFRKGTYSADYQDLGAQRAFTQGIVDRADTWDALIKEFGQRDPQGNFWRTRDSAENFAAGYGGHVPMTALEISPWLSLRRELEAARKSGAEAATADPQLVDRVEQGITHSLTAQTGRFVLAPTEVVRQLQDHFRSGSSFQRGATSITQAFKYTVLPTSDKWVLGNVLDQGIRAAFSGISPVPGLSTYNRAARRTLASVEAQHGPEVRAQIERQALSGGNYAQRSNYRVNEASSGLASAFHRVAQIHGPREVAWLYGKYANAVFAANGWMERQMELAGFGKAVVEDVRAHNARWGHALGLQKGAVEDVAKGLVNTDKQVAFAHSVEDIFGRWRGNSAGARTFITGYAPFYLWARNATRFVLLTLPVKHPIKTALISAAATATEQERKKLGLDLFSSKPLPGFLQGGIPTAKRGILPTGYYSSPGVFANYPGFLGNIILPQVSSTTSALSGQNFAGQQLTNKDGSPITDPRILAGLAVNSFAEGTIPFLSIARRTMEGGGSSAPTSTILSPQTLPKTAPPGGTSILGGLERVYRPRTYSGSTVGFLRDLTQERPIYIPAHPSSGGGGDAPWKDGSSSSSSSSNAPWMK